MSDTGIPELSATEDGWVTSVCGVLGLTRTSPPRDPLGTAPTEPAGDGSGFGTRYARLEPDLETVLRERYGDVSGIRASRDLCLEKAGQGDHAAAIVILDRLERLVAEALDTGISEAEGIPSDVVPFVKARLLWNTTRLKLRAELTKLEQSIIAACALDPETVPLIAETGRLYDYIGDLDARLEDKLEEIVVAPEGAARTEARKGASAIVSEYRAALGQDFFRDVDANNGFVPISVAAAADAALTRIEATLA